MKVTFILLSTATSFFLSAVNAFDAKKIKAQLMKGQIIPDGKLFVCIMITYVTEFL